MILTTRSPASSNSAFMLLTDTRSNGRFVSPSVRDIFHTP